MCLAVPMKVVRIDNMRASVRSSDIEVDVGLDLIDEVELGDWVIVHAGYAITKLSAEDARETLAIIERLEAMGTE